jgi:hypothetical protein
MWLAAEAASFDERATHRLHFAWSLSPAHTQEEWLNRVQRGTASLVSTLGGWVQFSDQPEPQKGQI